jgi:hypothetical protein
MDRLAEIRRRVLDRLAPLDEPRPNGAGGAAGAHKL